LWLHTIAGRLAARYHRDKHDSADPANQRETRTIPIVFPNVTDPVASGIVSRLDRPNGNETNLRADIA
jgi:hypothetical protein